MNEHTGEHEQSHAGTPQEPQTQIPAPGAEAQHREHTQPVSTSMEAQTPESSVSPTSHSVQETHPASHVQAPLSSDPVSDAGATVPLHRDSFGLSTTQAAEPAQREAPKRASGLFSGLAVGAIIGAIAGGATASVIYANLDSEVPATPGASQITITNPESSTQVSAIAQVATPSTVTIDVSSRTGSGTGSGVIYSADGYIITNAHVVTMEGASFANTTVRVMLSDGRMVNGTIVGSDPYADIAVIKIEADGLTPIQVSDTDVSVGDLTVAIGAPFNLSNTVTSGVVSTLNRGITVGSPLVPEEDNGEQSPEGENPYEFRFDAPGENTTTAVGQVTLPVIQTDASINPGNSGGPLLNSAGELIGINVAIASAGQQESEAGSVGLGFAIPSTLATRVADSIIAGETPSHGLLGATVLDARASETATQRGGLVREVLPGSAAADAGIQPGDIITAVNDVLTGDGTSVSAMIRYYEGGEEVTLTIVRSGQTMTTDVTLGSMDL